MAEVKWIKIVTDIFDDEKVLLIESLPEHDAIIVIWFKLLCLAGKMNNGGVFVMNNKIPYTEEMLSTIFRRPLNIVRLALNTFEQFGMIERVENVITIPNWSKHQTLDQLEERKEYMRDYMQRYREKQKQLACKVYSKVNSKANVNALDKDIDIDKEKDINDILHGAETSPCSNPPVITLILNDKSDYPIYQDQINHWNELYPAVDILQELKKMKGWLEANPTKRKTKRGILRFINTWLAKEQDKGGKVKTYQQTIRSNRDFEQREQSEDYYSSFFSNANG